MFHTEYSLLDGSSKIKELVHQAKELGMDSIAITDHGAMYGVIEFLQGSESRRNQTDHWMRDLCNNWFEIR